MTSGLIAALASPLGKSAIAVIRTSGPGCIEAIAQLCRRKQAILAAKGYSLVRSALQAPDQPRPIDDVLLAVFRAPRSYTGEDSIEIFCHGSLPGIDAILAMLYAHGFRPAQAGEFTLRAFINGKLDLTQAEAVQEIVNSQSREAQVLALHRLSGALFSQIDALKQALLGQLAILSVQLDYAEDELELPAYNVSALVDCQLKISNLIGTYAVGKRYSAGVRVALAGRTNAGKSSLFNALVREDRAIVSDQHGTTRDWLEANLVIGGIPVRLFDTAGLRETEEKIEAEGIRRSAEVIEAASITLYLVDASSGIDQEEELRLRHWLDLGRTFLLVWNKIDLLDSSKAIDTRFRGLDGFAECTASAFAPGGLADLHRVLLPLVQGGTNSDDGAVLVDSERQYQLLLRANTSLANAIEALSAGWGFDAVALDLQDTINALGEITGSVTSDDLLDQIFGNFCVGK